MQPRSRLFLARERRKYRIALVAFALLLMGASGWPSSCNSNGSGSSGSSSTGVLIAGGENSSGTILDSAELYDPSTGTFSTVKNAMSDGRAFQTATLLKNGSVLVVGGMNNGGSVIDSADLYAPSSDKFSATSAMSDPRQQSASILLNSGEVLITGGLESTSSTSGLYTAELYDS